MNFKEKLYLLKMAEGMGAPKAPKLPGLPAVGSSGGTSPSSSGPSFKAPAMQPMKVNIDTGKTPVNFSNTGTKERGVMANGSSVRPSVKQYPPAPTPHERALGQSSYATDKMIKSVGETAGSFAGGTRILHTANPALARAAGAVVETGKNVIDSFRPNTASTTSGTARIKQLNEMVAQSSPTAGKGFISSKPSIASTSAGKSYLEKLEAIKAGRQ